MTSSLKVLVVSEPVSGSQTSPGPLTPEDTGDVAGSRAHSWGFIPMNTDEAKSASEQVQGGRLWGG